MQTWSPYKGRPPLGDCIDFFSGSLAIPAVTHMHSIARALLCSMILGRREGHTHPRWVPSSSVPSFVSGVHTAFCRFYQWSFQKQESHILWPLRECTVYLMSGTSNKCLCSQCRNNPRQKTTVAMWRIPKRQGQELPGKSKERLFHKLGSPVRTEGNLLTAPTTDDTREG